MTKTVKVSVVIPCFNHGEFLGEAVDSVIGMKREDIELIVVDDGSSDEQTLKAINVLIGQGIAVIQQKNSGVAAARNAGISRSKGEYILPLDADNRLRPHYVEHGIRILDANPQVGVVYGDAEYFGAKSGRWHVGPFDGENLMQWNYIDACSVYRRSVWEQNRGYDPTMPVQGLEDWDFWLTAMENGWQFAYVPEVLFDYRVAGHSMITRTTGFEARVEEFIAKKHGLLYLRVCLPLVREHRSVQLTRGHLRRLIVAKFKQKRRNHFDPHGIQIGGYKLPSSRWERR